jgi:hypothetical protein
MMKIRPLSQNFSALGLGWMLLGALSAWHSRLVLTAASFTGLGPLFLPEPSKSSLMANGEWSGPGFDDPRTVFRLTFCRINRKAVVP